VAGSVADEIETGPLDGIRVVELATMLAGPAASGILAQLGADVVKVEPPWGDPTRTFVPGTMPGAVAPAFLCANASKRSMVVDMKNPEAHDIIVQLLFTADVVIDNFRPGVLERLGLEKEAAIAKNPGLIWLSITGYGPQGELASRPAIDQIMQAETGMIHTTGYPSGPGVKAGYQVVDHAAAHIAVQVALAALFQRGRTGKGRIASVSLFDAALSMQGTIITNHLVTGIVANRSGNQGPFSAPSDTARTSDGMVMLTAYIDRHWVRLCEVLDRPDLLSDPRFLTQSDRYLNREELMGCIEETTSQVSSEELESLLIRNDVMVGIVRDHSQVMQSDHVKANHSVVDVYDEKGNLYRTLRTPVDQFDDPMRKRTLPALGEHTQEILSELGVGPNQQERLRAGGVVDWPER
jgi:crotonobetainyl-CoA:carnitine CoA-transferase CaiB-like acyl-CoA transferase